MCDGQLVAQGINAVGPRDVSLREAAPRAEITGQGVRIRHTALLEGHRLSIYQNQKPVEMFWPVDRARKPYSEPPEIPVGDGCLRPERRACLAPAPGVRDLGELLPLAALIAADAEVFQFYGRVMRP